MAHIFDIGTRAWQPDTTEGWVASEVTDKQIEGDKVKLVFQLQNGEVREQHTTITLHYGTMQHTLSSPSPDQNYRDDPRRHPDRQ